MVFKFILSLSFLFSIFPANSLASVVVECPFERRHISKARVSTIECLELPFSRSLRVSWFFIRERGGGEREGGGKQGERRGGEGREREGREEDKDREVDEDTEEDEDTKEDEVETGKGVFEFWKGEGANREVKGLRSTPSYEEFISSKLFASRSPSPPPFVSPPFILPHSSASTASSAASFSSQWLISSVSFSSPSSVVAVKEECTELEMTPLSLSSKDVLWVPQ
mmetsp:Transcript_28423/g.52327  ORF Transcript_28423/g.52327 Transcript_28423/m.52327 type:complete len:225 (-) Transcript_28423:903-1577(-)